MKYALSILSLLAIIVIGPDPNCWQGNCKIVADNGQVTQTCDAFCNFYAYPCNYRIVCDGQECYNEADICLNVDGGPHKVNKARN